MKQHGPWKITSSEVKYKNPWIEVIEEKVIGPTGKPGLFGFVKIKEGKGGVSVLAMDDSENVYLTEEFHYAFGGISIEAVNGGIEKKELPLEAAKRELKEELGIEAEKWTELGEVNELTTFVQCPVKLFLARGLKFVEPEPDESEMIAVKKVKFKTAIEMVVGGEITHAPSCTLILKVNEYLKREK